MKTHIKSILFTLILALTSFSVSARWVPYYDIKSGSFFFNIIPGTNEVYLNGTTFNDNTPEHMVIPETVQDQDGKIYTVTKVSDYAFCPTDGNGFNTNLFFNNITTTITIPETVTTIEGRAFWGFEKLTTINFPASLVEFDFDHATSENAFAYCYSLREITLPSGLKKISPSLFYGLAYLETVNLPDSLKIIGYKAFEECESLKNVNLSKDSQLEEIGYNAFRGCTSLVKFNFPSSLKQIGDLAFHNTAIRHVELPDGIGTEYLRDVFTYCPELRTATVGEGCKTLRGTFMHCPKLTEVKLPESITTLQGTFYDCPNLQNVNLGQNLVTIGHDTFRGTDIRTMIIPPSVKEIAFGALAECKNLYYVEFTDGPDELTFMLDPDYDDDFLWGQYDIPRYSRGTINSPSLRELYIGRSVKDLTVKDCSDVFATINFGPEVKSICKDLLIDMPLITRISIPDKVETIGANAFKGCSGLTSLYLGSSVKEIGDHAFEGARNLYSMMTANPTPPDIFSETFLRINKYECEVLVPVGSGERYRHTDYWDAFQNFKEREFLPTDGVSETIGDVPSVRLEGGSIVLTGSDSQVSVYTVAGNLVARRMLTSGESITLPAPGLYIVNVAGSSFKIRY